MSRLTFPLVVSAVTLACGGGMGGLGAGGGGGTGGTASTDDVAATASDLAFQALFVAHLHQACATRSSCGAADAVAAPFPHSPADPHDVAWAIDHLGDADPNDALAVLVSVGLGAAEPALPAVRDLARVGKHDPRVLALAALGALGDVDALPVIERGLGDGDESVRIAAASAARMLGAVASMSSDRIRVAANEDPSFVVRCRAADAITLTSGERVVPTWTRSEDDLFAVGTPLPTGRCAAIADRFCTTVVVEEGDACLLGLTWGGSGAVATFAAEGAESYPHGTSVDGAPTDPIQLVTVAGEHWIISGSDVTGHPAGAVHLVQRETSGRLRAIALAQLPSIPSWYRVDGSTLVVQTADRVVYRVTKRGAR